MNAEITDSGTAAPIQWYARSAVDDFLAQAAVRRTELEAAIAAANERAERARAALGLYRMMAAMLLETQRELQEMRRDAEAQAAEIVRGAEQTDDVVIDLAGSTPSGAMATNGDGRAVGDDGAENAKFFDFLRGSLTDPETLDPRTA
jgi:cell division septum initiation protein DivIVA